MIATTYQPTSNDLALTANVPLANTRRQFDPATFAFIPNVPVFAEHETTCTAGRYEGRKLSFGYSELLAVCQRCNRRIEETGDYATVVIGHTPPKELIWKGDAQTPELVGFCGPFRMGQITLAGGNRRWAILADFHIFKEDEKQLRKYPRRSAELWLEEKYDDMFLDPIALLSAEAPRLDMGLLYSQFRQGGAQVEIYAAASAPSAASVSIPAPAGRVSKQYQGEANMAMAPEDIQQIVAAIMQTEPMQWCMAQMQQGGDPAGQPPGGPMPGAPAPGGPPPGAPAPGGPPQQNAGADPSAMGAPPPVMPGAPGSGPMAGAPPQVPPAAEPPKQYSSYDDAAEEDDELDDAADDADDVEEDVEKMGKYPGKHKKRKKKHYAGDDCPPGDPKKEAPEQYAKRIYRLEQELAVERYSRQNAERRAFFAAKASEGYQVDVSDEMEICSATSMSPEQFERYGKHFENTRSQLPMDFTLPAGEMPRTDKMRTVNGRPEVAEYSLAASDRARQICEAAISKGESVDYESVLHSVVAGKQ